MSAADPVLLFDPEAYRRGPRSLRERFGAPPLSVLDAGMQEWQERKRQWLALGIESELGREDNLLGFSDTANAQAGLSGTSIFDPVLCELAYRWWSPPEGIVLDPFAGGSVRGIVAAMLGREYHGVDLNGLQLEANREQADRLALDFEGLIPRWYEGDAAELQPELEADLLFSCPPYGSLEIYSKHPADISGMSPAAFHTAYRRIIAAWAARLRRDRFAVFVVGNYRSERTALVDLAGLTVSAFRDAGLDYYADVILVTAMGSAPMRASHSFPSGRKPMRRHQYVLVFVKGDWKKAAAAAEEALPSQGELL